MFGCLALLWERDILVKKMIIFLMVRKVDLRLISYMRGYIERDLDKKNLVRDRWYE